MYVYLNDLSAEPTGFSTETILSLLKEFIGVFSSLRSYQIEKLRVPRGFKSENQIFGSIPIKDLVISLNGDTDYDLRTRILTFLNNVEEARPSDHSERINLAQQSRLVEVRYDNIPSDMLSEAFLLVYPVISFRTHARFDVHFLPCEALEIDLENEALRSITLPNFFDSDGITRYHGLLLSIHHNLLFARTKWDPFNNPSWRTAVTSNILALAKYPGNRNQLSLTELRSLNAIAAELVLDANGWEYNRVITNYNRGKEAVWKIYTNNLTNEQIYISVDLGEGEFEMQDRRGRWRVSRFFDGSPTGKDYGNDRTHDIIT